MKAALPVITFALRHALAVPLAIAAGCVLWTVAYVVGALFGFVTGWSRFAAIPVVFVSVCLFSLAIYWLFSSDPMFPFLKILLGYVIFLSVPLGGYWWVTEGSGAVFEAFRRWRARRRIKSLPGRG